MPRVEPLRAIGYALDRFGDRAVPERVHLPDEPSDHPGRIADLTDVACPPYDVIAPAEQAALLARHPLNAVRLERSAEPDPHAAAATTLRAWIRDGVLERRQEPAFFYYSHAAAATPDEPSVHGVLARVLLEPFGEGVRAHEHTLSAPKADRLALLETTGTQLSPILALYFDRSERYRHVMSRGWSEEWRARDRDGLIHTLAAVEPDERMANYLSRHQLFIADGHHRYETALAFQAEVRARPGHRFAPPGSLGADWIMAVLVNAELEELEIHATHRLLRNVDAEALAAIPRDADPLFEAIPAAPDQLVKLLEEHAAAVEPIFGLVLPGERSWLLVGDVAAVTDRMRREPVGSAVQRLDLAVLHAAVFADRLGIDIGATAAGEHILYTKEPHEALARVRAGEAQAAVLVRPTRLDQLAAVAVAGDFMPQKSTYFYPKLLTGLAFHPLEPLEGE
jgi:uncharacterized protein (DUF1015 family)